MLSQLCEICSQQPLRSRQEDGKRLQYDKYISTKHTEVQAADVARNMSVEIAAMSHIRPSCQCQRGGCRILHVVKLETACMQALVCTLCAWSWMFALR